MRLFVCVKGGTLFLNFFLPFWFDLESNNTVKKAEKNEKQDIRKINNAYIVFLGRCQLELKLYLLITFLYFKMTHIIAILYVTLVKCIYGDTP